MAKRIVFIGCAALAGIAAWVVIASTGYPAALEVPSQQGRITRIDNVRIVSMVPDAPEVQIGLSVFVQDGTIRAVGKRDALSVSSEDQVIDGAGQMLLPGLIDGHVHIWDEAELAAFLAHGVTSVRNMSGMPFHLELQRRIESGHLLGPDFVTTGRILNTPGPNAHPSHQLVTTPEEARAAVRAQHAAGFRTLKVYSNLHRETYAAILDESRRLDLRIVGHTPEGVREPGVPFERPFDIQLEELLDDGFSTLEHVESIVWHGLADQLDEGRMRVLAERIAQSKVPVTPTLIAHDNLVRVSQSKGSYLRRAGVETLNPLMQWLEKDSHEFWSAQDPDAREGPRAIFYRRATHLLHQAGVPLVAGTDAGIFTNIPGSSLIRELELLVAAGLTEHQALAAATVTAGRALGLTDRGQIAPGFRANFTLVPGDPLANITLLEHPSAVMVGGIWLDSTALDELREASRQTSVLRTARRVVPASLWR